MPLENTPIQFIDLQAQRATIKEKIDLALQGVMNHGQYILGPEVTQLEAKLCEYTGAKHVITCASGTDALKLVLLAKSLQPKEVVFLPSFTFAATAEVVAELGAIPYFVDVCPNTYNIDPLSLKAAILEAKSQGLTLKGIIAVDLFGLPADYPSLQNIADENQLWLLADAAQSFGGTQNSKKVGQLTDVSATSFFPSKPLGCYGDGGCVFTQDSQLNETIRSLRVHGAGKHRYDHIMIGLNSRLDTFQAAILIEKLKIFDGELKNRQAIAQQYNKHLKAFALTPQSTQGDTHAYGLYTLKVDVKQRDLLQASLTEQGIPSTVYYKKPLHCQSAYKMYPKVNQTLPVTDALSNQVLSIPMHPYLTQLQVESIITAVKQSLS